ncbi:CRISPR-associated endonuclease Cas2 [Streptomyces sp. SL13]|uniref:CRISPR-associated endoribonuclease Cas2 n=1 Tax=Streptantibioticus silvisoli TaxID=2705255 RepID=A0AA90KBS6_9ACTN|nr:CRISPR-associated endonuclease Cas2 [Streptantibioticus silvisoli]MDI5973722.1 CRISPR-associated endonuclease Cas2 [Streptantibioticus silvisoli]
MHVIVVYDTAAERNPRILRTCRQYLHHVQRSVFEGQLTPAQLRRFQATVETILDLTYDNVIIYTLAPGTTPFRHVIGTAEPAPTDII